MKSKFNSIIKFIRLRSVGDSFTRNQLYDYMKDEGYKTFITSCDSYLSQLKCNGYINVVGNNKKNTMYQISITPREEMNTTDIIQMDKKRKENG